MNIIGILILISLMVFTLLNKKGVKLIKPTQYVTKPISTKYYTLPIAYYQIEAINTIGKLTCNNKYVILSDFVVKDGRIKLVVYEGKEAEKVREML